MLIPYLSRELHEALLLGARRPPQAATGRHRPQGRPQACMGPAGGSWDVICTSVQSCITVWVWTLDYQYQSTTFTDIMLKSTYYSRIKCSMLFGTYYAQNYASIIRPGLLCVGSWPSAETYSAPFGEPLQNGSQALLWEPRSSVAVKGAS